MNTKHTHDSEHFAHPLCSHFPECKSCSAPPQKFSPLKYCMTSKCHWWSFWTTSGTRTRMAAGVGAPIPLKVKQHHIPGCQILFGGDHQAAMTQKSIFPETCPLALSKTLTLLFRGSNFNGANERLYSGVSVEHSTLVRGQTTGLQLACRCAALGNTGNRSMPCYSGEEVTGNSMTSIDKHCKWAPSHYSGLPPLTSNRYFSVPASQLSLAWP